MKIGTIGTGGIVEWVMAEALRTDGMEWGAVCSRREATGRALADRFGVPRVYTDLDAMLADGELDFIYVASPNSKKEKIGIPAPSARSLSTTFTH